MDLEQNSYVLIILWDTAIASTNVAMNLNLFKYGRST